MKTVYDEETQKLIDSYENRKAEIREEVMKDLDTATGLARRYKMEEMYPYYNPIRDNPEYEAINNILFRIHTMAVPKYLISKEDYERVVGANGNDRL